MLTRSNAIHLLALFAAALTGACRDSAAGLRYGPAELDESGLSPVAVHATVLASGEDLALPTGLALWSDTLAVIDNASQSVVHLFSAGDGRPLAAFGRHGAGPGEFRGAWSFVSQPGGPHWVYDVSLGRLTALDALRPGRPHAADDGEILTLRGSGTPTSLAWSGDSLLVASGFFPAGRLAFFDAAGVLKRTAAEIPVEGRDVPPTVRQEAFIATLVRNPERGLVALTTRHADQLEIYRADGSLVRRVKGPFAFAPVFTVGRGMRGPVMASGESLRFGYVSAAATNHAIYALFSGRTREGFHDGSAVMGRHVHVYDWAGELREVLQLDADVIAITVDPAGRTLYALRHDPTPAILSYPLPG